MAGIDPHDSAFRSMLIKLNSLIQSRELEAMKFQSKSAGIGDRNLDRIETALDLWQKLEERGHLGPHNLAFLKTLLQNCTDNRRDVLDIVTQFEVSRPNIPNRGSDAGQEDVAKEIRFLEENLGRDWKFFMRSLGISESKLEMCIDSHPRNVKEQIHMAFSECMNGITKAKIIHALADIHRNDLKHKISTGLP